MLIKSATLDCFQTFAKDNDMATSIAQSTDKDANPFASWKVDHAALRVPDFDAAIAWYTGKLNFRLRKHVSLAGLTFAFLSPGGDDSFIFELLAGPGADNRPTYPDLHASYKTGGWHHVCFRVESVDAAIEQLKQRAVTIVSEPHDVVAMGLRVAFFTDPWGNYFEVTELLGNRS
jgi:catechol 2,3-dioxygenase-like lactoylglutathione lyase family enzyme